MNLATPFGLGDLAYYAFRPAVYLIDWTWGTDMRHCDKCKQRRKRWNKAFSVPLWVAITFLVTVCLIVFAWR